MAQEHKIDGNLINDARPIAVEQQGALPAGTNILGATRFVDEPGVADVGLRGWLEDA